LLDAITWALWGKARGKTHDELNHFGCDDMLVELEFLARDDRLSVTRRHSNGGGRRRLGASDLQLQIFAGEDFRPITGNSIRETQASIDRITGMDYDTFTNSAFLLQGRADEFTNKTAGERKEVLAKILGLDLYDQLQNRAKKLGDGKEVEAKIIEGDLEGMRREVGGRDRYSVELQNVNREHGEVDSRLNASRDTLDALKSRVDDLRRKRSELDELNVRIPTIESEILDMQKDINSRRDRIAGYQALVQERDAIRKGLAELLELRRRYEELNASRERFDTLTKVRSDLERAIESARTRLEEQIKQMEKRVSDDLRPRADAIPSISSKLDESKSRLDALAKEDQDIVDRRQHVQALATQIGELKAVSTQLQAEGQEIRSKLDMVQDSHQDAQCPLCGTQLGPDGCDRLLENYKAQREAKAKLYRQNDSNLKAKEKEQTDLDQKLPKLEAALRRSQREVQEAVAVLQRQLDESTTAAAELDQVVSELEEESARLKKGDFSAKERRQLAELEAEIEGLGYDRETHNRLYNEIQELQPFDERYRRLEDAETSLPQEQDSLSRNEEMLQRRREDLSRGMESQRDMKKAVAELPVWEVKLGEVEKAHRELDARNMELSRRQGDLEGHLKRLDDLEKAMDDKEGSLKAFQEEQSIYRELTEAFGKRGAQAMLIETVLPQIEKEANDLLGRMTDGRMHLKLETQREPRSRRGEPIETLEIKISDEMGPRSYELFSGGEAFRINLALRISLSKVLAHRRGAPLPTLFIDEGFGTQDAAGRERILDVIRAIEEDFKKIIVITHLDELKEAFPARIEVQKEETGSIFWIS
ncbi:MAG: SMC family ATPase, partial [Dehalococcoidia bacterium]|nr:SMC family ATPase [Dehalococcoidia bacterium]